MTMLDLAVFYDPDNWTRGYWEVGAGYTIVKNRHIGLDITTRGQAKKVPALVAGTVVDWEDTYAMGRVIIVDVGLRNGKYLSYCHMSKYDTPPLGYRLHQGELFGRIATGPKSVGFGHANFPGNSWDGAHLHLVWHNKPGGAYLLNQKDSYSNPEVLIREVLSTPAGTVTTPFEPKPKPKEWDEMATQAEIEESFRKVLGERLDASPLSMVPLKEGGIHLLSLVTGKRVHIENTYHLRLLRRAITNNSHDTMLAVELDIVASYISRLQ